MGFRVWALGLGVCCAGVGLWGQGLKVQDAK